MPLVVLQLAQHIFNSIIKLMRLLLMLPLFLLFNCAGESIKQQHENHVKIITSKKWKYDAPTIREAAKSTIRTDKEQDLMNSTLERLKNSAFFFNEDGTMLLDMEAQQITGEWKLSEDSKEFYINLGGTSNLPNPVISISPERITLGADYENGMFFPKIFAPFE